MREIIKYIAIIAIAMIAFHPAEAKDMKKAKIKTSAVCGMCKNTIETALSKVEGVQSSNLNVKTKIVKVVYDAEVVSEAKIKEAISNAGYNADDVARKPEAYDKLHECCKDGSHEEDHEGEDHNH